MELVSQKEIKTEVDTLLELVRKRNEISFEDTSKSLGISFKTVESLAGFLEQEGLLAIKYKLTTPYLIKTEIKDNIQDKADEFLSSLKIEKGLSQLIEEIGEHVNNEDYVSGNVSIIKLETCISGLPREKRESEVESVEKTKNLLSELKKKIPERFNSSDEKKTVLGKIIEEIKEHVLQLEEQDYVESKEESKAVFEKKSPLSRIISRKTKKMPIQGDDQQLILQAYKHIKAGRFKEAKEVYHVLDGRFKQLPNKFIEQKNQMKGNLVKLGKDLAVHMDKSVAKEMIKKSSVILTLVKQSESDVKKKNIKKALESYNQIQKIYVSLPKGFLQKKIELQTRILEVYKLINENRNLVYSKQISLDTSKVYSILNDVKNFANHGKISEATKSYNCAVELFNKLPPGFMHQKIEIQTKILEVYRIVMIKQEEFMKRTLKQKSDQIIGLVKRAYEFLNKNDLKSTIKIYAEIEKIYAVLPSQQISERVQVEKNVIKLCRDLAKKINNLSEKVFVKKAKEINRLLKTAKAYLKKKEYDLAEEAYREMMTTYSVMPDYFLSKKVSIRDDIFDVYRKIMLERENVPGHGLDRAVMERYEALVRNIIKFHQYVSFSEFEMLEPTFSRLTYFLKQLPLGFIQEKQKLLDEVSKIRKEVELYRDIKQLERLIGEKRMTEAKKWAEQVEKEKNALIRECPEDAKLFDYVNEKLLLAHRGNNKISVHAVHKDIHVNTPHVVHKDIHADTHHVVHKDIHADTHSNIVRKNVSAIRELEKKINV